MNSYKTLEVWNLSMEIVREVYTLTKTYPIEERYGLGGQTNRAAVSVPANIAEGMGRNFKKEKLQFLHISRGSAYELDTLLNIAKMIGLVDDQCYEAMGNKIESSIRMINGLINYLKKQDSGMK